MIGLKKVLALIPARGGSKGIPHKNIVSLCEKPLIAYSIEAALNSKFVDAVYVSTDDVEIQNIAKAFGARSDSLRPDCLAQDTSKTIDCVVYTVDYLKEHEETFDILLLLQPTSPLRTSNDIDSALEVFIHNNCRGLVSVSPVDDHPILIRTIREDGTLKNLLNCSSTVRRQDMPDYYRVNGAIYINLTEELTIKTSLNDNVVPFVMSKEHSLDIDEPEDLLIAEVILRRNQNE